MPSSEPLVRVLRGGLEESSHRGALVLVEDGREAIVRGDPSRVVYYRSASKPLQALEVVRSGAADAFGLSPEEIAIAAGSHNGEPRHLAAVRSILVKAGVPEEALRVFSTRRQSLLEHMEARGTGGFAASRVAALATREAKEQVDLPRVLHEARLGNAKPMNGMLAAIHDAEASEPASDLSQGLHASALCGDWTFPWGDSSAPLTGRAAALRRYAASLPKSAFWPFDRATAAGNGIMQQCLYWPPTAPVPRS